MDERIRASPASAGKGVDERILAVLRERMREADGSHGLAGDTQLSFQGMVDVCRRTFELPETEFSDAQLWTLFAQLSDSSDFMLVSALDEFLENDGTSALVARPFSDADSSSPAESQRQEVDWGNEREQPVLDQTLSNSTCNAEPARAFAHGELHALHVQMLAACSLPALAALGHASSSSFSSPHASSTDGAGAGVLLDEAQLARFVRRDLKLDEVTMPPDRIHVVRAPSAPTCGLVLPGCLPPAPLLPGCSRAAAGLLSAAVILQSRKAHLPLPFPFPPPSRHPRPHLACAAPPCCAPVPAAATALPACTAFWRDGRPRRRAAHLG